MTMERYSKKSDIFILSISINQFYSHRKRDKS